MEYWEAVDAEINKQIDYLSKNSDTRGSIIRGVQISLWPDSRSHGCKAYQ